MTPKALATLHARAMPKGGVWSEKAFADLLATPGSFLAPVPSSLSKYAKWKMPEDEEDQPRFRATNTPSPAATRDSAAQNLIAFALGRVTLDEAELLMLAVDPDHREQGVGRYCLAAFEAQASEMGAARAFLEVAASNRAARALYTGQGWAEDGKRPDYYATPRGREDAILMSKTLKPA